MFNRRQLLKAMATLSVGSYGVNAGSLTDMTQSLRDHHASNATPTDIAKDETYWAAVAKYYKKADGIINLEQGYWGKMATPVEKALTHKTHQINQQLSWYARKQYPGDIAKVKEELAEALGASTNEVALTRNATESFVSLLTQYKGITSKDTLLWADADYPSFQRMMAWLADQNQAQGLCLQLPDSGTEQDYLDAYKKAFDANPNIKLMLLTHVSNQHGLTLPVKDIVKLAKRRGIDVICDCAQSWGLLNFTMADLGVDWAVFNLHKWIGSPVGVGALYMRDGSRDNVSPFPGENPSNDTTQNRVHVATSDFAAFLTIPDALNFHFSIGADNKAQRLQYLRQRWVDVANTLDNIVVLGAKDAKSASGMGAFRVKDQISQEAANALQLTLEKTYGVFTVVRNGLSSGCCIRVTPQVFTSLQEIDTFAKALLKINANPTSLLSR